MTLIKKSLIAIATTVAITGCSTIELYPKQTNASPVVEALSKNKYKQLEVVLTDETSKTSEVIVFDLDGDRLTPKQAVGNLGNKSFDLRLSVNDCPLCIASGTDMSVFSSIRTEDIIQVTQVGTSTIGATELPSMNQETTLAQTPVNATEEVIDEVVVQSPKSSVNIADSLDDGEEIVETALVQAAVQPYNNGLVDGEEIVETASETSLTQPVTEVTAQVVETPAPNTVKEFTPPQGVKPFLYKDEDAGVNPMFTRVTQVMQVPLAFNNGHYTDVISKDTLSDGRILHTSVPITVKVRLIPNDLSTVPVK